MCWYCGCHTTVARRDGPLAGYLHALHQEIALVAASLGRRLAIDHVHFGGGTPTILQPEDLLRLVARLRATFPISAHAEMAIEIDPISARSRRRAFRKRALATSRRKPSGRRSSPPVTAASGLDHYALPGDSMAVAQDRGTLRRNFQGYTTDRSDVLLALGASAIGRLPQGYVQNEVVLGRYAERLRRGELPIAKGYGLTRDDRLRADLIERVMCDFRVDVEQVCRDHQHPESAVVEALPALERPRGRWDHQYPGHADRGRAGSAAAGSHRRLGFR